MNFSAIFKKILGEIFGFLGHFFGFLSSQGPDGGPLDF